MKRILAVLSLLCVFNKNVHSQYADIGTGALKNYIWWFDWNGFAITNGASRTITTADGLTATLTFSNVQGPVATPNVMNTWYGSVLHLLYNFTNTGIKPALLSPYTTQNSQFTVTITATRNGVPAGFKFVAADAEASAVNETITLTSNGSNWTCIDFFRNSSQTSNPLTGCNSSIAQINDTYAGSPQRGQNPVIATDASATGSLTVNCAFARGVEGQSAIAFGIFSPVDRGDLPAGFGYANHRLTFSNNNVCNFMPPFPALIQSETLKLGMIAGDADAVESTNDNAAGADEDAISSFSFYTGSGSYSLTTNLNNTTGANAYLTGWFDFNRNGMFENSERITNTIANNASSSVITWTGLPPVLPGSFATPCAFRFRLSSDMALTQSATGFSPDGEVEDYSEFITLNTTVADFFLPDTVCVNSPVNIQNLTQDGTNYYWNFCSGSLNATAAATNFASPNLSMPVFMDIVQEGTNYYVFVVNHTGSLARMSYGNSLLNTPVTVDLGSLGGVIPWQAEGIEIRKDGNNWIGYIIGGQYAASRLLRINFGTSITNTPVATNLGNVGNVDYPVDLTLYKDGVNWYGFTVNADNNTITRYSFGSTLANNPVATNLNNVGGLLNYPVGMFLIKDANQYHLFVTNRNGNNLTRVDFGTLLTNTPTAVNLGNPGGFFNWPRDINVIRDCDKIFGFVSNEGTNAITRLDFTSLTAIPATTNLGNLGNLNFPSSISEVFRTGNSVNFFLPNVNSNSVTRISFTNCSNSTIPSFNGITPPAFQYSQPGTYNVSLFVDEGLPTQSVICKQVVVNPIPVITKSLDQEICNNTSVQLSATGGGTYAWTPAASLDDPTLSNPTASPVTNTKYYVTVTDANTCTNKDSINVVVRPDPVFTVSAGRNGIICETDSIQLTATGGDIYTWQPASSLNNPTIANPRGAPTTSTNYSVSITDTTCHISTVLQTTVTVNPLPLVKATKSNDLDCVTGSSQLNATGAASYTWTPALSLNKPNIANPVATPSSDSTRYLVKGTNALGCSNYDSVSVFFSAVNASGYFMPNAFTPNRDGLNDCFSIKYWGVIRELEFSIYNRWGQRIFFTKDPGACWDGTYNGVMQDVGVFVYMIKAKTLCGDSFKKGLFTLVK